MVSMKSILKYHGVYEWLMVRISAVWMLLYIIYISSFIMFTDTLSYDKWYEFFSENITKTFSIMTLLSAISHTWIGIRHILEDYITLPVLKKFGMWITGSILFAYLLFGTIIIWSV